MIPEYWLLGEDLQDKIRAAGYEAPTVDGIAVDFHDLLQSAARIQEVLVPALVAVSVDDRSAMLALLNDLKFEFDHIAWHCQSATTYLDHSMAQIASAAR